MVVPDTVTATAPGGPEDIMTQAFSLLHSDAQDSLEQLEILYKVSRKPPFFLDRSYRKSSFAVTFIVSSINNY